jgi:hypothetical protein
MHARVVQWCGECVLGAEMIFKVPVQTQHVPGSKAHPESVLVRERYKIENKYLPRYAMYQGPE